MATFWVLREDQREESQGTSSLLINCQGNGNGEDSENDGKSPTSYKGLHCGGGGEGCWVGGGGADQLEQPGSEHGALICWG